MPLSKVAPPYATSPVKMANPVISRRSFLFTVNRVRLVQRVAHP